MSKLFTPLSLKSITLKNRIGVSPMCQYSAVEGEITDWHLVHLGSRAVGGAGLVIMEATAVEARGRISPADTGLWSDAHIPKLKQLTQILKAQGAVAGIQLAHAGRKASTPSPWDPRVNTRPQKYGTLLASEGGWPAVGPSPVAFDAHHLPPTELNRDEIKKIARAFAESAGRALAAGFEFVEIHAAHGYLLNSFLSPLSNQRSDEYGGSFENRTRFLKECLAEVQKIWPAVLPLAVRLSCVDWHPEGWQLADSVRLATELKSLGVDLIDCSSGGNIANAKIEVKPLYQTPFAEEIKRKAGIATAAVGLITQAREAESIVAEGRADLVLMARELLRHPYWPIAAARELGAELPSPRQYGRAFA